MNIYPTMVTTPSTTLHARERYLVYVVFELPKLADHDQLTLVDNHFLLTCLNTVQKRNQTHLHDGVARSNEYFTSLNHSQRYRVPKALTRLNLNDSDCMHGILAFQAYRNEPVKNKSFNQRVASINPDILVLERLEELFAPTQYPANFSRIGQVVNHTQAAFVQVSIINPLIDAS